MDGEPHFTAISRKSDLGRRARIVIHKFHLEQGRRNHRTRNSHLFPDRRRRTGNQPVRQFVMVHPDRCGELRALLWGKGMHLDFHHEVCLWQRIEIEPQPGALSQRPRSARFGGLPALLLERSRVPARAKINRGSGYVQRRWPRCLVRRRQYHAMHRQPYLARIRGIAHVGR